MSRCNLRCVTLVAASALCACCDMATAAPPEGGEQPDTQKLAARLQTATVTLRIVDVDPATATAEGAHGHAHPERITVTTGVSLGDRQVITFAPISAAARCRATLPNGEQAIATLRVIDEFSGLALLEIEQSELAGLELASEPPALGAAVMTAAASGIEQPTVSWGIVAGCTG